MLSVPKAYRTIDAMPFPRCTAPRQSRRGAGSAPCEQTSQRQAQRDGKGADCTRRADWTAQSRMDARALKLAEAQQVAEVADDAARNLGDERRRRMQQSGAGVW